MSKKIVCVLICMLFFTTIAGAMSSTNTSTKTIKSLDEQNTMADYSHTILGEYGTMTTCVPCKYAHQALKNLYGGGYHPMYYITYVYNKNEHAKERIKEELGLDTSPTTFWDGGFRADEGAVSTASVQERYNTSILLCGARTVKDIDIDLNATWNGANNRVPEDEAIDVPIEQVMAWDSTEMHIEISIDNNEASQYKGHLHVYVTEINSTRYNDKFGNPYTHEFQQYAFNKDVTISAGNTWSDSTDWDGLDYNDGQGRNFENISKGNTLVIASVFRDGTDYSDETAGDYTGINADPQLYDIYFGNVTPPPLIIDNVSSMNYYPQGGLNFSTDYYWKVVEWDNNGDPVYGDIFSFTTRGNTPPTIPSMPFPWNNSKSVPINTNISWNSVDPEGDDVYFDIYFGDTSPPPLLEANYTGGTEYEFEGVLQFNYTYFWRIKAWDEYGYNSTGPEWNFMCEGNKPPYKPSNPIPADGVNNVPVSAILNWTGEDPNPGDKLTYDVYFSLLYPPTLKSQNQSENWYDPPGNMEEFEDYHWKIVSWDSQGKKAEGDIWNFSTGLNYAPSKPNINGPKEGEPGENHSFTFTSEDPDGDNISYYIDWDDGNITDWTPFKTSGTKYTEKHSWAPPKTHFYIKAKAKDIYGLESEETVFDYYNPKSKHSTPMIYQILQQLMNRFYSFIKMFTAFPVLNRIINFQ